jgi:hypothetical protein
MLRGLDYAGGRPDPAAIAAAGYSFVCRYLSDGGPGLPGKLLLPAEAAALRANGIDIVSNWETIADAALGGYARGITDAQAALARVIACGGSPSRPIYFSVDFDATPQQQDAINAYLTGIGSVLGVARTGIYAGYWPLSRALDAGVAQWGWQTEAWSGGNLDPRAQIIQRNSWGYATVDGVQCDINEATDSDYGQWSVTEPEEDTMPDTLPIGWLDATVPTQYNAQGQLVAADGSNGPNVQMPVWQLLSWLDGRVARAEGALSALQAQNVTLITLLNQLVAKVGA